MEDRSKKRLLYAYYVETSDGMKKTCCCSAWEFAYGVNSKTKKRTSARRNRPIKAVGKAKRRQGLTQREGYAAEWLKRCASIYGDQLPFGDVLKETEIRIPFGNKRMV
jgi:hypothetical protein